jgi:aspartate kinase
VFLWYRPFGVLPILLENKKTGAPGVYHKIAKHQNFHGNLHDLTLKLKEINRRYTA